MTTCYEPLIRAAFECLRFELGRLSHRWRPGAPAEAIRPVLRTADRSMASMLDEVELAPFDELDVETAGLVHDAYMRVLALADLLAEGRDAGWTDPDDLAYAYDCALDLLDALAPCVSLADRALRKATLDGIDLDDASQWADEPQRAT